MTEVPETQHQPERGRLTVPGRRTDTGRRCDLGVVREADGSWSVHGPGEPGVRLTCDMAVTLAEAILARCEVPRRAAARETASEGETPRE